MATYSKLFGCSIYKSIRVESMALKIINTPEFQRLRNIKQLALCYLVYPAATHTRFEHSLGAYHLAGQVLDKIKKRYPQKPFYILELGGSFQLDDKIIECIKLAALCHDLGHGPYSHVFDNVLLMNSNHPNRHHETRSCLITEIICKRELSQELSDREISFIKSLIKPGPKHQGALYQIVSNYLNGVDVDKFDYLMRDSTNLGMKSGFDYTRLINEIIIDENDNIAYPKHCSVDIYEMFHCRYMLYKKVYFHKTVKILESMFSDLFLKIDPILQMSESIKDMSKFCQLTDYSIFHYLELINSPLPFLQVSLSAEDKKSIEESYHIYQSIITRKLYKQIAHMPDENKEVLKSFVNYLVEKYPQFRLGQFQIIEMKIDFVNSDLADPLNNVYFYDKKENNCSFTLGANHYSAFLANNVMQEKHVLLISKDRTGFETIQLALREFLNHRH